LPSVTGLLVLGCPLENSAGQRRSLHCTMQLSSIKTSFALIWVSAIAIAGFAGNFTSLSSWAILAAVALAPPLVVMWRWSDPAPSMSEAIQKVLR
jgi:hypothetical protein